MKRPKQDGAEKIADDTDLRPMIHQVPGVRARLAESIRRYASRAVAAERKRIEAIIKSERAHNLVNGSIEGGARGACDRILSAIKGETK